MGIEVDENQVTVTSKEVKTKNSKELGTERSKEAGTENSAEEDRKVKENDIVDTVSTSSDSVETEAGPDVEVLKSGMRNFCFIQDSSFNHFEDEIELETGCVLTEKVNLVLANPP